MLSDSHCTDWYRFVDMGFNALLSDSHCMYIGGSGFNQIVPVQIFGYGFQCDLIRSSLYVYIGGSGFNQIGTDFWIWVSM